MVRLRFRCRCVVLALLASQIGLGLWFYSQPLDPPQEFLKRLFSEGGQTILHLTDDDMTRYYTYFGRDVCVREGVDEARSSEGDCVCRDGWTGRRCGVPRALHEAQWLTSGEFAKTLQLRKRAKRVVMVCPFSHEFDVFETNVNELDGLVDVFIIGETNHTTQDGANHSLPILEKLKSGWLKDYQSQIIYVPVTDKDLHQSSFTQTLVHKGLRLVSDIRPDDLFILTTGEEVMSREVLVFLKLFQGYPLPVRCRFQNYMYGFFWKSVEGVNAKLRSAKESKVKDMNDLGSDFSQNSPVTVKGDTMNATGSTTTAQVCATSFQFLANAFEYQISRLQEGNVLEEDLNFFTTQDQKISEWTVPNAGWKCHLCLSVQTIFRKLISQTHKPKWLQDTSSSMQPFIQRLIKFGQDEELNPIGTLNIPDKNHLPAYVWQNREKFRHLLHNPYETVSIHNLV